MNALKFDTNLTFSNGDSFCLDVRKKSADLFPFKTDSIRRMTPRHLNAVIPLKQMTILLKNIGNDATEITLKSPVNVRSLVNAIVSHYNKSISVKYLVDHSDEICDYFGEMTMSQIKRQFKKFKDLRGNHVFVEVLQRERSGVYSIHFGS